MGFAGEFGINGLFSHWQVWMIVGVALQGAGAALNRYGQGAQFRVPGVLPFYSRPKEAPQARKVSSR